MAGFVEFMKVKHYCIRLLPEDLGSKCGGNRDATIVPQMVHADGRNSQGNGRFRNGKIAVRLRLPHGWDSTFLERFFFGMFKLSLLVMIHV